VVPFGRWYSPDGRDVRGVGLEPNAVVPLFDQDRAAGFDRQLQEAFALMWQVLEREQSG
jgi:C-terminal processing protease CtpA/Prc